METWVWVLIAFLVLDAAITAIVLTKVTGRRRRSSPTSAETVGRDMGLGPDS